jgi:hypothetical protein
MNKGEAHNLPGITQERMAMERKCFVLICALLFGFPFSSTAAPLASGTMLQIDKGAGSAFSIQCASGSCIGFQLVPGLFLWIDVGPGTDGGLIVGKAQVCGGQDSGSSETNTSPGEMTSAFSFGGHYATLCTSPGGDQNIFDDTGCAGAGCSGKTDVKHLYFAWNGQLVELGSSAGCTTSSCTPAQQSGIFINNYAIDPATGGWILDYSQVIPSGSFTNFPSQILLRGNVAPNVRPVTKDVTLQYISGLDGRWPVYASDLNGDPLTCRIGTPPAVGTATVEANCAIGSYSSPLGFVGIDSFTYIANDGQLDSLPGTVTLYAIEPDPTPSVTLNPSITPSFTPSPTPLSCTEMYPVRQITQTGREGTLSVTLTGNIMSYTNKVVSICLSTPLSYQATSNQGPAVCKRKNNTTSGSGTLRINDHLKCTDKPSGKDKVQFKVKSGISK